MSLKEESVNKVVKAPAYVRFDEEDLPELVNWKVGGKYKLTLEVEQTSMSKGDEFSNYEKSKPKTSASFKVLSVQPLGGRNTDAKRPNVLSEAMKKRI